MKFYPNNIDLVINKIKRAEITALLIYGPDNGLISELLQKTARSLSYKINPIQYESPSQLFNELNNFTFFAGKDLIKVELNSAKLEPEFEKILLGDNIHFPVFIIEELSSGSSLRKFFEANNNLAIIACYADEEKSVRQIITNKVNEYNKHITPSALEFLTSKLHGNRLLILNELDKLLCYLGETNLITIEHCYQVISDSIETNPDLLCINFASKKSDTYLTELETLLENSIPIIWILRALARYYQNLLIVKLQELDGVSIENAMTSLKPAIFYKYAADFKNIANKTSVREISNCLENITFAEIEAKTNHNNVEVLDNLFIKHFLS